MTRAARRPQAPALTPATASRPAGTIDLTSRPRGRQEGAFPAVPGHGPWTVIISNFNPPTTNALLRGHWAKRARVKRAAVARIILECLRAGVPPATGPRRVAVTVAVVNRSHAPDPDNTLKVLLDALRDAGAILDDRAGLVEWTMPVIEKGPAKVTTIVLEDC